MGQVEATVVEPIKEHWNRGNRRRATQPYWRVKENLVPAISNTYDQTLVSDTSPILVPGGPPFPLKRAGATTVFQVLDSPQVTPRPNWAVGEGACLFETALHPDSTIHLPT